MIVDVNGAPCGAGKTYAQIAHAAEAAKRGEHVMLVQPTRLLIAQTAEGLRAAGCPRVIAIHGDDPRYHDVVGAVVAYLRAERQGGEVLLLTHAAHQRLPYVHRRQDWTLVYDEAPAATWCGEINLPNTHALLTPALALEDFNPEYCRVRVRDAAGLRVIAQNRDSDDVYALLAPVANVLLSRHWEVYVDAEQYSNTLDAHGNRRKLIFHAALAPSLMEGYRSATILAADAGETTVVHVWSDRVRFVESRAFDKHLRYTRHPNGPLLTIEYLSDEDWSKNHRDKRAEDGRTLLDHGVGLVKARFAGEQFAWQANTDQPDSLFGDARAVRLPNTAHGLNAFQHIHRAALLSALNPPPAHFAFLSSMGIDSEAVRTALYRKTLYQAACRTSLRDPGNQDPKHVIVPDRATAEWLAEKFPGCGVAAMDAMPQVRKGKPGRPRLHESQAIRNARHRALKREEFMADLAAVAPSPAAEPASDAEVGGYGNTNKEGIPGHRHAAAEPPVFASLYLSLRDTEVAHRLRCRDWAQFADALRAVWRDPIAAKGGTAKLIPADMDPAWSDAAARRGREMTPPGAAAMAGHGGEGQGDHRGGAPLSRRGTDNVRSARLLVLDNDGGDLSRAEFARLFPRWQMLIVNSYSSTPGAERWRVFLPCDIPVTAELYKLFTGRLLRRLNRAGYWSRAQLTTNPRIKSRLDHGFDTVKLGAASIFDLPSQAGAGPAASFFVDLREGRQPIDVEALMRRVDLRPPDDGGAAAWREAIERLDALPEEAQRALWEQVQRDCWAGLSEQERRDLWEVMPEEERTVVGEAPA